MGSKTFECKQKEERIRLVWQCLRLFEANKDEFLVRFVTMDETWIHQFDPETNRQSME